VVLWLLVLVLVHQLHVRLQLVTANAIPWHVTKSRPGPPHVSDLPKGGDHMETGVEDFLQIEDLEDRSELVHGACACTTSCGCTSCSCVVWW
jgi:hypothetical protein